MCTFTQMGMELGKMTVSKQGVNLRTVGLRFTLTTRELLEPALYETGQTNPLNQKYSFLNSEWRIQITKHCSIGDVAFIVKKKNPFWQEFAAKVFSW